MSVHAMMVGKSATVADFENIAPLALYKLAAKSTPDTVREEMLERARQGEHISLKIVVEAVEPQARTTIVYSSPEPRPPTMLRCSITAEGRAEVGLAYRSRRGSPYFIAPIDH
jgi:hypothetical protein